MSQFLRSGKLVLGEDVGGPRHFLDGKPVHCGQGLEMKTPTGWIQVRYEASLYPGDVRVYLYASPWSAPRRHKAGPNDVRERPWCVQCERHFSRTYEEPCDEPDWGPTVVVASRPDDFKSEPRAELRWPDPKRDDRSIFDRD